MNDLKKVWKIKRNEKGAMVVDSAIVYPIVFFVLLFLLYMGNLYYLKAKISSVVSQEAIKYASYFADPMLEDIEGEDGIPDGTSATDSTTDNLYRYINILDDGQASDDAIEALEGEIKDTGYFSGMTPWDVEIVQHGVNNYVIYQTYTVEVSYKLKFPIKFIFSNDQIILNMSTREEVPVVDTPEFIRNVDMAIDILEQQEGYEKVKGKYSELYGKVSEFITKAGEE